MFVPSASSIREMLFKMGPRTKAVDLCQKLVKMGWDTRAAQLGMQRAMDSGHILINNDFTLKAGHDR